jgi:hypothetical protein
MRLSWVLGCVLLAGCASDPVLTPSQLNKHASLYDGKVVRVHGWLVFGFEDFGLWDSKRDHDNPHEGGDRAVMLQADGLSVGWPVTCVSVDSSDPKFEALRHGKFISLPVIVDGIFRKTFLPPNVISNGICNESGLQIDKISVP